ncbi:MAG: glycerophosphodiester phosphodiesterase family protein [Pseudomonadota bacterium]
MKQRFRATPNVPMISVHRGLWGPAPENSLAAIRAAARFDVVEIDLRLDADGQPYLMHDSTLDRMTGKDISSNGPEVAVLEGLALRSGDGGDTAEVTEETVPTLDAAFQALASTRAIFDLDVKRAEDISAVADFVAKTGANQLGTLKVDVANQADLDALLMLEKTHDVMVMAKFKLRSVRDLALLSAMRAAGVAAVELWFDDFNLLRRAAICAGEGMRLTTYTLDPVHCCGMSDARGLRDPAGVWGQLIGMGIGLIMTDRAPALSRYLTTR